MGDKVAAAFRRARMHDELARYVIKRAQNCDFLGLPWRLYSQIGAGLCPDTGEIRMRQRLALVAVEKNRCRPLRPAVCAIANADQPALPRWLSVVPSGCAAAAADDTFFRNAFDSWERLMRTPSWVSISARRRGIVQLGRLATGASNNGVTTRKAASLFTGGGPGATLASSASAPLLAKSLRHRRTVSSRTPNASAMVGLVHPASVSSTARARSASPRSREPARAISSARCSSVALIGDLPDISITCESVLTSNRRSGPLVNPAESA